LSINKGTLLGENSTFLAVSRLPFEGYSETQDLALCAHATQNV